MAYMTVGGGRIRRGLSGLGAVIPQLPDDPAFFAAVRANGQADVLLNSLVAAVQQYIQTTVDKDFVQSAVNNAIDYGPKTDSYWILQLYKLKKGNETVRDQFTAIAEKLIGKTADQWGSGAGTMEYNAQAALNILRSQLSGIDMALGMVAGNGLWSAVGPKVGGNTSWSEDMATAAVLSNWDTVIFFGTVSNNIAVAVRSASTAVRDTAQAGAGAAEALKKGTDALNKIISNLPDPAKAGAGIGLAALGVIALGFILFAGSKGLK